MLIFSFVLIAMYGLLEFLTNGKLDAKEHVLNVPRRRKEKFRIPKHERTDLTKIIDIREVSIFNEMIF